MNTKSLDKVLGTDMFRFIWPAMQQAADIALRLAAFDSDFWGEQHIGGYLSLARQNPQCGRWT